MGFWICYNCGSYNVFEKMYVRLNRLACIVDDVDDLIEIDGNTHGWCGDCNKDVIVIEGKESLYKEI